MLRFFQVTFLQDDAFEYEDILASLFYFIIWHQHFKQISSAEADYLVKHISSDFIWNGLQFRLAPKAKYISCSVVWALTTHVLSRYVTYIFLWEVNGEAISQNIILLFQNLGQKHLKQILEMIFCVKQIFLAQKYVTLEDT